MRLLAVSMIPVALVNFASFVVVTLMLGGDALNGKRIDGHYYLAQHGHLTEVSAAIYRYSLCHAISVIVTHAAAFIVVIRFVASRSKTTG